MGGFTKSAGTLFRKWLNGKVSNPGPALGEDLFKAFLEHPEGLVVGTVEPKTWDHFKAIVTEDNRINLDVPEMTDWLKEIEPSTEAEETSKRMRLSFP